MSRRHGSGPRPERFFAQVLTAIVLLLAWAAVAHASGSGWVQAIGALAAGLVVVGMVAPAFAARRLRLTCTAAPVDGESGSPLVLGVKANRSLRCTPIEPRGRAIVVTRETNADLEIRPPYRGVLRRVEVKLSSAAPLGLLWWSVTRTLTLPSPVLVAPVPSAGLGGESMVDHDEEGDARPVPALTGELRGVRDYRHGDSRRLVHWRATAHTSHLMVRELEERPDAVSRVVVRLPADAAAAEMQASEALATVLALLAEGRRVILDTAEDGALVSGPVVNRRSAGRRLARADHNPYATAAAGDFR